MVIVAVTAWALSLLHCAWVMVRPRLKVAAIWSVASIGFLLMLTFYGLEHGCRLLRRLGATLGHGLAWLATGTAQLLGKALERGEWHASRAKRWLLRQVDFVVHK
jgi:hypothetical protein